MISDALLAEVRPVAEAFAAAGHRLYLVGGIVRDQLLGRPLVAGVDLDLTTDANPAAIKALVGPLADAVWSQGERFGTIGCRIAGREYEITTHRGESYEPGSRKPSVVFSEAIEHDLERRDFTVNAMAVRVPGGDLVDPFGGRDDLAAHRLRTPLAPEVSFSDDPLRMLRAARFVAGYGLSPDGALLAALDALADRMAIVSVERRRDELEKLLALDDPRPGLHLVLDHGLAPYVLPWLGELSSGDAAAAVDIAAALPADTALRLAALASAGPAGDTPARRLRALRCSNDEIATVSRIVAGATAVWRGGEWSDPEVRRFVVAAGDQRERAILLASTQVDVTPLRRRLTELGEKEDLSRVEGALDGDDVMRLLGIAPGTAVGEALAFLRELRIEEGELDRSDAADRLRAWWAARG